MQAAGIRGPAAWPVDTCIARPPQLSCSPTSVVSENRHDKASMSKIPQDSIHACATGTHSMLSSKRTLHGGHAVQGNQCTVHRPACSCEVLPTERKSLQTTLPFVAPRSIAPIVRTIVAHCLPPVSSKMLPCVPSGFCELKVSSSCSSPALRRCREGEAVHASREHCKACMRVEMSLHSGNTSSLTCRASRDRSRKVTVACMLAWSREQQGAAR